MLKAKLLAEFVPHLPPLLPNTKPQYINDAKNLSRAFSAWPLSKKYNIPLVDAAKAVVDDFDDCGVDVIFYETSSRVLYLVQSKLKDGEDFALPEAQKLIQGVRDLVNQRYLRFNKRVQDRQADLEHALEDCKEIRLVIAYVPTAGVIGFAPGQVSQQIRVATINDSWKQQGVMITLNLSNPVNAILDGVMAPGTIADGTPALLAIGNASAQEGSPVSFPLTLSRPLDASLTVNYYFYDGTAQSGNDYTVTKLKYDAASHSWGSSIHSIEKPNTASTTWGGKCP